MEQAQAEAQALLDKTEDPQARTRLEIELDNITRKISRLRLELANHEGGGQ
jgi:hypothetical protein